MTRTGRLRAMFSLDDKGRPRFVRGDRLKHYFIQLKVDDLDDSVESVTLQLDPSYHDPIREVFRDQKSSAPFSEEITSYGNFKIEICTPGAPSWSSRISARSWLSEALRKGIEGAAGDKQAIQSALNDIESH
jgi:hypothetical protein